MKKIYTVIVFAFWAVSAYGACPAAYPHNVDGTDICYLITAPGEYVPVAGGGAAPCPIGAYCPGGDKIYNINIPERYTPVEYLENNGTAYIDTDHIPTSATTINADVLITGGTAEPYIYPWRPFIGADLDCEHRYGVGISLDTGFLEFNYFTGSCGYEIGVGNLLNKRFNFKTQILDSRIYALVNNNNIEAHSRPVAPALDFPAGIHLFKMSNDCVPTRTAYGRFYFYQVRESDELVQSMIPVYDTESKLYGMYDTVGKKFFGSANSDKFTGGPVVEYATIGGNFSCAAETHNEFTVSPPKSETITDCGRILHVGSNTIYMRRRKIAPHALAARVGDTIFYAEMTTENCGHVRIRLDGVVYSICNTSAD